MSIEELWIQLQLAGVRFLLLRLADSTVSLSELDKKAFRSIYKFYDGSSYTSRPCFLVKLDEIQKFQPLKIKDCEKTQWWWFHLRQFYINPTHTKTNYDLGLFTNQEWFLIQDHLKMYKN